MTMQRIFHPISGVELRKMIVRDLENMLEKNSDFTQNIVYPHISYEVTVRCVSYPREPAEFTTKISGGVALTDEQTGEQLEPSRFEKPKIVEVNRKREASSEEQPPDKTREEMGLPILTRGKDTAGVIVDKELTEPAEAKRGPKTKVTIKNRAAQGFTG